MENTFKKSFGFVFGIFVGLAAGDFVMSTYEKLFKTKKTEEPKTEE